MLRKWYVYLAVVQVGQTIEETSKKRREERVKSDQNRHASLNQLTRQDAPSTALCTVRTLVLIDPQPWCFFAHTCCGTWLLPTLSCHQLPYMLVVAFF